MKLPLSINERTLWLPGLEGERKKMLVTEYKHPVRRGVNTGDLMHSIEIILSNTALYS